ncbi:hypothetical protein [Streptomyces sp. NPDC058401]|uniref:hypothetical protein n=1 Tax=Streptomyces sp. NPDC058401 TaxID=3346480 RepID=UPI00364FFB30
MVVHEQADELDERTTAWMKKQPFCRSEKIRHKLQQAHVGALVARMYPHGEADTLEAITRLLI